jgi:photosystem II stability/assembly factor-like uncharacterized protein
MKYILYISILLFGSISNNATGQWNYLNTGETRHLYHLEVFGEDTVYAFGFNGAFISSFDGGLSWALGTVPNLGDIYFSDFINKYTGVVLDGDGNMSYTINGGISWQSIGPIPGTPTFYDINLTSDSTIILTGYIGWPPTSNLFISNDWGNSWNLDSISLGISTGLEVMNDSTWILGFSDYSLFKTNDRGANWQNVLMGNIASDLRYLISSDDSTIFGIGCYLWCDYCFMYSMDQGNTWNGSVPMGNSLFFFKNGSGTTITGCGAAGGQGLNYSADTGYTNYLSHYVSGDTLLTNIKHSNNYVGYVCGWYGTVLKTTNGGATAINETPSLTVNIQPNPFSDHLNLSHNSHDMLTFKLFDESSRVLVNQSFTSMLLLNTSSFSRGIYFYSITNNQGSLSNGILIKVE